MDGEADSCPLKADERLCIDNNRYITVDPKCIPQKFHDSLRFFSERPLFVQGTIIETNDRIELQVRAGRDAGVRSSWRRPRSVCGAARALDHASFTNES